MNTSLPPAPSVVDHASTLPRSRVDRRDAPSRTGDLTALLQLLNSIKTATALYVTDSAGRIVAWNDAAAELLGYTATEVLYRRCFEVLRGTDSRGNMLCYPNCAIVRMLRQGKPPRDFLLACPTKDRREVLLNVSILAVGEGSNFLCIHCAHDVRWIVDAYAAHPAADRPTWWEVLTPRERTVLGLLVEGRDTREVARILHTSYATIRNHVQHILEKMGVHTRLQAVMLAMREGFTGVGSAPAAGGRPSSPEPLGYSPPRGPRRYRGEEPGVPSGRKEPCLGSESEA